MGDVQVGRGGGRVKGGMSVQSMGEMGKGFCPNFLQPLLEDINRREVVHEKEEQEWAYHGALWDTTVHWNGPRVFYTHVYSRDPTRKVCFNPTHDDTTKTEGLHFRQKTSVVDGVKGLGKIKVDNINCVTLV